MRLVFEPLKNKWDLTPFPPSDPFSPLSPSVSDLSMAIPEGVLATGLAVSTDGAKVYAAGYNPSGQPTFTILPIN